jgi:hypothetical protein
LVENAKINTARLDDESEAEICGATKERDFGSHRGGLMTLTCTEPAGHNTSHSDTEGHAWDDNITETPAQPREHEPPRCDGCKESPKLTYMCEIYKGFSCNQLVAAYNAGRADMATEVGRTYPEAAEADLEPDEVIERVAELLDREQRTNDQA